MVALGPGDPPIDLRSEPLSVGDRITWSVYVGNPQSELAHRGIPQKSPDLFKYGHERLTEHSCLHEDLSEYCLLRPHTTIVKIDYNIPLPVAAIMEGMGWLKQGLVDLAVDVEHIPGCVGRPAPFMFFHAMRELNVQSVHEVIKVGDTPADMLEGHHAGCAGIVGVLSGPVPFEHWRHYRHTHIIGSVAELPELIRRDFM